MVMVQDREKEDFENEIKKLKLIEGKHDE